MSKTITVKEAIVLMTDEAERQNATVNDENGIVRGIVAANLPGRPNAQFSAWFCICCELADRKARKAGFDSEVDRAYTMAVAAVAKRRTAALADPRNGCTKAEIRSMAV